MTVCRVCGKTGLYWHLRGHHPLTDRKLWELLDRKNEKHDCRRELFRKEMALKIQKAKLPPYHQKVVP